MVSIAEVIAWRENVLKASLEVFTAERNLSDDDAAAKELTEAEDRLALAARELARSVDLLEPGRQPKGWAA